MDPIVDFDAVDHMTGTEVDLPPMITTLVAVGAPAVHAAAIGHVSVSVAVDDRRTCTSAVARRILARRFSVRDLRGSAARIARTVVDVRAACKRRCSDAITSVSFSAWTARKTVFWSGLVMTGSNILHEEARV
jgi:hypothetical protein